MASAEGRSQPKASPRGISLTNLSLLIPLPSYRSASLGTGKRMKVEGGSEPQMGCASGFQGSLSPSPLARPWVSSEHSFSIFSPFLILRFYSDTGLFIHLDVQNGL